jgi:CDGSH-type Zn-finger protein
MNLPKIASKFPSKIEIQEHKSYAWCSCGLSIKQPYCDGKHKGTEFKPIIIQESDNKSIFFCNCKQTSNSPYCDGTHNNL